MLFVREVAAYPAQPTTTPPPSESNVVVSGPTQKPVAGLAFGSNTPPDSLAAPKPNTAGSPHMHRESLVRIADRPDDEDRKIDVPAH
jgi:hypothetical protein